MQTIILVALIVVESIVLIFLSCLLIKNNRSYKRIMRQSDILARGDLNVDDIQIFGRKSNATVIAGGFNAIKNNLLTFIEANKVNVITLSDALDVLSKSVDANLASNEQIADGVTTVAEKSAQQLDMVEKNLQLIESNNLQVQDIDDSMTQIQNRLNQTVQTSQKGITEMEEYSADVSGIAQDLSKINSILDEFNDEIKQISDVGEFIISINKQLTLLAFNASIEAARAGEAGKGFTVVADEMNKMSGETAKGMSKINDILDDIIESSNQVNASIRNCESAFAKSNEAFENVNVSFNTISQQASDINYEMQGITEKTNAIAKNSGELKNQADGLLEASHQISERTHEIAGASQESAAESTRISENVSQLDGMLNGLQKLLIQFRTAVIPTTKDSSKKLKFAFLSMLDNDFWYGVKKGVVYAQKELAEKNVCIDYHSFDTESNVPLEDQIAEKLQQCIDENYDGIIAPGFLKNAGDYFKQAVTKGINLVAFNCDMESDIKRLAHFSPNGFDAGVIAGKCMEEALNKKGNIALLTGDKGIQVNKERTAGFMSRIATHKGLRVVCDVAEQDFADAVYKKAMHCIDKYPEIDAFYVTTGFQTSVARAIEAKGKQGKIVTVGFDDNPDIVDFIKKGIIYATITQDPFGQGHDPIVWLFNHLAAGDQFPKEDMGCRLSIVTRENVDGRVKI